MKKFVFAVVIAAVAASPAMAAKKKSKKMAAATPAVMATTPANTNENSARFVKDALPVFLPSWTMPAYLATQK